MPIISRASAAMTWAQRLKRVLNINIETDPKCGGAIKVIACIEDPVVIDKILNHLDKKAALSAGCNATTPSASTSKFVRLIVNTPSST